MIHIAHNEAWHTNWPCKMHLYFHRKRNCDIHFRINFYQICLYRRLHVRYRDDVLKTMFTSSWEVPKVGPSYMWYLCISINQYDFELNNMFFASCRSGFDLDRHVERFKEYDKWTGPQYKLMQGLRYVTSFLLLVYPTFSSSSVSFSSWLWIWGRGGRAV